MGRTILTVFLLLAHIAHFSPMLNGQSLEPSLSYVHLAPYGKMGNVMEPNHGFAVEMRYRFSNQHWSAGIGYMQTWYSRYKDDIEIELDQQLFITPIVVNHRLSAAVGVVQYDFTEAGPLQPFLALRGYAGAFVSRVQIRDPAYTQSGEGPLNLVEEGIFSDPAFFGGLSGGLRLDLGALFGRVRKNQILLLTEFGITYGSSTRYAFSAVDDVQDGRIQGADKVPPAYLRTTEFHDLEVYRSPIQFFALQFGVLYRIER